MSHKVMKKRAVLRNSILLVFSAFFAACGDMNTVIAKDGSYEMEAFVGSRNLDDGAAISSTDSIRPSFSSEAEDDPDVTGIRISLETPAGKAAASDVVYRLSTAGAAREAGENPILVPRLSGDLPAFDLPADLAVGRYVLVMRVLGADGVLFEKRRSIYYLADAELSLTGIVSYPPGAGTSSTAPLFPTKAKLLLRAEIEADDRLDPYVAWYFGTKLIGMGRLADGANQILWETPLREGFQTLRVEVYPEPPLDPKAPDLVGASADITIATAETALLPGLPGTSSDYVRLYRFLGDLTDSADASDPGRAFVRTTGAEPIWVPIDDSYGLSVGTSEQYRLDLPLAPVRAGGVDVCRILTRVTVSGKGVIWRASFSSTGGAESLQMELASVTGGLELRLLSEQKEKSVFVSIPAGNTVDEAVLATVTFSAAAPSVVAEISVNDGETNKMTLPFSSALLGSGTVRLGGTKASLSATAATEATKATGSAVRSAVIDELGVMVGSTQTKKNTLAAYEN
jgi:hypothetical protein